MALTAVSDEDAAQECVRETWGRMLSALQRRRFDRSPQGQARRIMFSVLAERVGVEAARASERTALREDGTLGLDNVQLPESVLEELSGLSGERAPAIRTAWRSRRHLFRGMVAALVIVAGLVWAGVFIQRAHGLAQLKYECLRQRVIEQDLASAMREAASRLEDPTGADHALAADCERVTLVLEEIANSESLADLSGLRFVRQRIIKHQLADFLRALAAEDDQLRRPLQRVALVLEEVQNL